MPGRSGGAPFSVLHSGSLGQEHCCEFETKLGYCVKDPASKYEINPLPRKENSLGVPPPFLLHVPLLPQYRWHRSVAHFPWFVHSEPREREAGHFLAIALLQPFSGLSSWLWLSLPDVQPASSQPASEQHPLAVHLPHRASAPRLPHTAQVWLTRTLLVSGVRREGHLSLDSVFQLFYARLDNSVICTGNGFDSVFKTQTGETELWLSSNNGCSC